MVPALIKDGKYSMSYLGISGGSLGADLATAMKLDAQQRGVLVASVVSGGPADKAGLLGSTQDATIDRHCTACGSTSIDDQFSAADRRQTRVGVRSGQKVALLGANFLLSAERLAKQTKRGSLQQFRRTS